MPPLEAMLLGCPAVIAPCGALPEVCGTAALAAPADDAGAWARVIANLAADPALWQRQAEAGRARALPFTWDRAARVLAATLKDL